MSDFLAKLKGWRTMIVMAIVALLGILSTVGVIHPSDIASISQDAVGAQFDYWIGVATTAISGLAALLRLFTTTATGQKS